MKNFVTNDEFRYNQARKKVHEMRGFYINLISFCVVIPILIFINLTFSPDFYWFIFSTLGWGIGLFSQWMHVFGKSSFFGVEWERKLTERMMAKSRSMQNRFDKSAKIPTNSSASHRVKKLKGFYYHVAIFIVVNLIVFLAQYFRQSSVNVVEWSNFFPLIIWGVFLFFHAFDVYWSAIFLGRKWEENKIREIADKENASKWE